MISQIKRTVIDYLYTGETVKIQRIALKNSVAGNFISGTDSPKSIYVDVSIITQGDARTGIQRVVRAILSDLQRNPPPGYKIYPVFATNKQCYQHVPHEFSLATPVTGGCTGVTEPITVGTGDIFLGLDLAASILPAHHNQLEKWKKKGAKIHILIYDLLPALNPEWFHSRTTLNFYRWIKSVAVLADSVICISNSVKNEMEWWLKVKYGIESNSLPIHSIPMGCDMNATLPSKGLPENSQELLQKYAGAPTALMLGTLEPRKGQMLVIKAFEELWKQGHNYQLAIIGKVGWKTQNLQMYIENHKELNQRLFWQKNASDQFIDQVFQCIYGLILASKGEGFGLPIVEAATFVKPILARDIPVFRELKLGVSFFDCDDSLNLSYHIHDWFQYGSNGEANPNPQLYLWETSAGALKHIICQDNTEVTNYYAKTVNS